MGTNLYHRTAAKLCQLMEAKIIRDIQSVPDDLSDWEFNRRLNRLNDQAIAWAERRRWHEAAIQLTAGAT